MTPITDLLVVGAGPAGMAAAIQARALGLSLTVLDEQPAPGGQIYRALERRGGDAAGLRLIADFRACGADYRPQTNAWNMEPTTSEAGEPAWRVTASCRGVAAPLLCRRLLLSTGARERPMPFPGWTLPGVMTAGALQIALKGGGLVPEDGFVLAGHGPLLLLLATQLLDAGARPAAILSTTPPGRWLQAVRHLPRALGAPAYLLRGMTMLARLRAAGLVIHRAVTGLTAEGEQRLRSVRFQAGGREHRLPARLLAVHDGVIPDLQAAMALGCAVDWHPSQRSFVPSQSGFGMTSLEGVHVAGDGASIDGAEAAPLTGRLAAIGVAMGLGRIDPEPAERMAAPLRRALERKRLIRPLLEALYAPGAVGSIPDDALACRCEEVSVGDIRRVLSLSPAGARQIKAFTRCGMGPCQGRNCGPTLAAILADAAGQAPGPSMLLPGRFPLRPVTLAEMAAQAAGVTEVARTA